MLPKSLLLIEGNQTKEAMKSANSFCCIEGNKTKETMSCAFSFLSFKEAKQSKSFVAQKFALQEEETEETID